METISSLQYFSSFSTIMTTDFSGSELFYYHQYGHEYDDSIDHIDIFKVSTITQIDLSGVSTLYGVDINGVINLSTMSAAYIRLDHIQSYQENMLAIETSNKTTFENLDFTVLKGNLLSWAKIGYPDSYIAYVFPVKCPPIQGSLYECSDGVLRNVYDYIPFFLGYPVVDLIARYQAQLQGITLTISLGTDPYSLQLHVSR